MSEEKEGGGGGRDVCAIGTVTQSVQIYLGNPT